MTNDKITAIILAGGKSSRMGRDKALLPVDGVPLLQKVCEVAVALCDRVYIVTPWQERYQHFLPVGCEFVREQGRAGSREQGDKGTRGQGEVRSQKSEIRSISRTTHHDAANIDAAAMSRFPRLSPACFASPPPASPLTTHHQLPPTNYQLPITNTPIIGFAQGLTHVKTEWVLLLACDLPCLQLDVLQDWANELEGIPEEAIALLPRHSKGWEPLCGFYRRSCLNAIEAYIDRGGRSFQQWLAQHPVQPIIHFEPSMLFNCNTPADYASVSRVE